MIKRIFFPLFFLIHILCFTGNIFAQEDKRVVIVHDSITNQRIDSVNIEHFENNNLVSHSKGYFKIKSIINFSGSLLFSLNGYSSKILHEVDIKKAINDNKDTIRVILTPINYLIDEVVITEHQNPMSIEFGKVVYDLTKDNSKNVTDVISKMPFITIDGSRKIKLNGSSFFLVLVNDKPSFITSTNISEVMRSYPKENLTRIEIITDIPPKYSDQNYSGIINFITNKKLVEGHSTSFDFIYGRILASLSGNSTLKSGPFVVSINITADTETPPETVETNSFNTGFLQENLQELKTNSISGNIDITYRIDSTSLITGRTGYSLSDNSRRSFINIEQDIYNSTREEVNRTQNFSLSYFKNRNKNSPTFDATYQYRFYRTDIDLQNNFDNQNGAYNNLRLYENTFQFDVVYPLKKIKIDYGIKVNFRKNAEEILEEQSMDFNQNIFGIYNSYVYVKGKFGVRAGGRLERTISSFHEGHSDGKQDYYSVLPYINIQQILKNRQSLSATYSQKIQRPAVWQLTSFQDNFNPNNIYVGNIDLNPVKINSLLARYTNLKKGSFISSLEYTFANNTIQRTVNFLTDSTALYGFDNLGKSKELKTLLNISRPLYKSLSVNFNGTMSYKWVDGFVNNYISNNGLQGFLSTYLIYKISENTSVTMNFGYYSPEVYLQGTSNSMYYYGFGYNRSFFKNILNFNASVLNPFREYAIRKSVFTDGSFSRTQERQVNFRSFQIGLSMNFNKLKERIAKAANSIKNDDINTSDSKRQ